MRAISWTVGFMTLTPYSLSNNLSINSMDRQPRIFPTSIKSISSSNIFHAREISSGGEIRTKCNYDSNLVGCDQLLEGVEFRANCPVCSYSQRETPLQGEYSIDIRVNQLYNQFKRNKCFFSSSLEGAAVYVQNFSRSYLSWFNSFYVTFPACFLICWPFWLFFWLFIAVVNWFPSFIYLIGVFSISNITWVYWSLVFFKLFVFQTVSMKPSRDDSFEQLLNQFVPINRSWFSSDRARPRFRSGAVRPKRPT